MDGWMDGWTDRLTYGQTNGLTNGYRVRGTDSKAGKEAPAPGN